MNRKHMISGLVVIISIISSIALVQAGVLTVTKLGPTNAVRAPPLRWKLSAIDPNKVETIDHMYYIYHDPILGTQTGEVVIRQWNARSDGVYIILEYGSIPNIPDDATGSKTKITGTYDGLPFEIYGPGFLWRRWGG
jgi:hypothetical protein